MMSAATKQMAVWLDHAKAYLIGHESGNAFSIETLRFAGEKNTPEQGKGRTHMSPDARYQWNYENTKQSLERSKLDAFLKTLESRLTDSSDILLFGPGIAKHQLYNHCTEKKSFSEKKMEVLPSGPLSENERLAYVRDYFKT